MPRIALGFLLLLMQLEQKSMRTSSVDSVLIDIASYLEQDLSSLVVSRLSSLVHPIIGVST